MEDADSPADGEEQSASCTFAKEKQLLRVAEPPHPGDSLYLIDAGYDAPTGHRGPAQVAHSPSLPS